MLLLDHNLPHQLRETLISLGFKAETTRFRGWEALRNGELCSSAYAAGFRVIVTRDRKFAESASRSLTRFPEMAIVIIRLSQGGWSLYETAFREAWAIAPFVPESGKVISWPKVSV